MSQEASPGTDRKSQSGTCVDGQITHVLKRKGAPPLQGWHQGVNIIRPSAGADVYTIVLHFDTLEHLQGWLGSETRQRLIAEIELLLASEECVEIKTGLEFWFNPPTPAQKHPPPYKQFLLTLSVIFPLTVLVPWVLRPLFQVAPALGLPVVSHFVISAIIVGLATYVIMPRYTRLTAGWLYR